MKNTTELKQRYQQMIELSNLARQRYLEAGGDPRKSADESYFTDEEEKEFLTLGRQVFGVQVKDGEVTCQGRSWKIPLHA